MRSLFLTFIFCSSAYGCGTMPKMDMGMNMGSAGVTSQPIQPVNGDVLLVINGGDASISVIDASSNKVAGTIKLGGATFPHHIGLSPDGAMVAVAIPGMDFSQGHEGAQPDMPGWVAMLDAQTGAVMATRKLPAMPHNAAFSPNGSELWVGQMSMPGEVLVLDPMTLETRQTVSAKDMPAEVSFSYDGKRAFVCDSMSNDVEIIDPATKQVLATLSVPGGPVGAWRGGDNVMYVDSEQGRSVTPIDVATGQATASLSLGFVPGMVATAPNGELWVTNASDGRVTFWDKTSRQKTGELHTGDGAHAIVFSADGKTAYVTNQMAASVSVIDVASHSAVGTIAVGGKPNGMVFRPRTITNKTH